MAMVIKHACAGTLITYSSSNNSSSYGTPQAVHWIQRKPQASNTYKQT